ncbi:hypothetical protein AB0M80_43715 [Amycolatopsis sp. NPDC051045]|uniref:esterase/lipase family protein n=1 Tax=Amycolatopsis sp. NPDC051045 TaxID=3156922 RepID=UPI0034269A27
MTELVKVSAAEDVVLDVVFVHGLDGDPRESWSGKQQNSFWPGWLAQDVPGAGVWSLGYDAASSRWIGNAMPIQDRAINLLAQLENHGIGQRPLCFVTHSMGGLVVKEMLLHAAEGRAGYAEFATATRGVVFLATPHTGSDVVTRTIVKALGVVYRKTSAVDALERNSAHLRQLNDRYRDWIAQRDVQVEHRVFYETQPTRGVQVVDADSANPGLPGQRPIPVDADHIGICKPADTGGVVYGQVKLFVIGLRDALLRSRDDNLTAGGGGPPSPGLAHAGSDTVKRLSGPATGRSVTVHGDVPGIVATGENTHIEQHTHIHQAANTPPVIPVHLLAGHPAFATAVTEHAGAESARCEAIELQANGEPPENGRLSRLAMTVYAELADPPFTVIRADPAYQRKWDDVLDGVPLRPEHAVHARIVERRVEVDGVDMDEAQFAEWLTDQAGGRAIGFSGQAGDGKTSFLNRLAVTTCETHVFVAWLSQEDFDLRPVERFRQDLVAALGGHGPLPTVVVVYPLLGDMTAVARESLRLALLERPHHGDEIVVLIEGRHSPIDRLRFRVSILHATLSPVDHAEAVGLVDLLTTAHVHVAQTYDEKTITRKWPNLNKFVSLAARDEQIRLITHDSPPVLVAMLRAVYGDAMWTLLTAELENLGEADQEAYFQVCLATAANTSLSEELLRSLVPGADIKNRSNRDPWIESAPWEHEARHQVIAQVVLEKASERRRRLNKAIQDYCAPARWSRSRANTLLSVVVATRRFDQVGTKADLQGLRSDLWQALRAQLCELGDLPDRLVHCYETDYRPLLNWARALRAFLPHDLERRSAAVVRSTPNQVLRTVVIEILAASAERAEDDARDDIQLQKQHLKFERQYVDDELVLDELIDELEYFHVFMNSRWWSLSQNYVLYRWSRWAFGLLDAGGIFRLDGVEARKVRVLYKVFLVTYIRCQKILRKRWDKNQHRKEYVSRLTGQVHEQVPEHAGAILKHAWEDSVRCGKPQYQLVTLYVESELAKGRKRPSVEHLGEVERVLWQAVGKVTGMGEPLLYLAMLRANWKVGDPAEIDAQVMEARVGVHAEEALRRGDETVNGALLDHAQALLEEEESSRMALLQEAGKGYRRHADGGGDKFARVAFAWKSAWRELSRLNPAEGRRQQRWYEKLERDNA